MTTRWGILGCSRIALSAIVPALHKSTDAVPYALASRNAQRAEVEAGRLGIPRHFGSYEQLLDHPDVDAVYIPLPNRLHHHWARRALEAGKPVLVEKPAVMSWTEAADLVSQARERNLLLAEAAMYRFRDQWRAMTSWLTDNVPPDEQVSMRAHIGFDLGNGNGNEFRRSVAMGGGALYDLGSYPVNAASTLFGRAGQAQLWQSRANDDEVDDYSAGLLAFPDGCTLAFDCDFRYAWVNTPLELRTRQATVLLEHAFNPGEHSTELLILRQGSEAEVRRFAGADAYAEMLSEFSRACSAGAASAFARQEADHLLATAHNLTLLLAQSRGRIANAAPHYMEDLAR